MSSFIEVCNRILINKNKTEVAALTHYNSCVVKGDIIIYSARKIYEYKQEVCAAMETIK